MFLQATFGDEPQRDQEEPAGETGSSGSSIDQFLSSCFPLPSLPTDPEQGGAEGSYYSCTPREPTSSTVSTIGDSSEEAEAKATAAS